MPQFNISGDTILEPFTTPSDIFVNTIGKISTEDDTVFSTAAHANDHVITLENGTELDFYIQNINPPSIDLTFASDDLTFDDISSISFDANDINRIKED